jgi:hypothetical protein
MKSETLPFGVWFDSICCVVEAISSSDLGNVGTSFLGNNHAADWDTGLGEGFHACVIEELLESLPWRVLDVVF